SGRQLNRDFSDIGELERETAGKAGVNAWCRLNDQPTPTPRRLPHHITAVSPRHANPFHSDGEYKASRVQNERSTSKRNVPHITECPRERGRRLIGAASTSVHLQNRVRAAAQSQKPRAEAQIDCSLARLLQLTCVWLRGDHERISRVLLIEQCSD